MALIETIRINSVKSSDRVQPVRRVRKSPADDDKNAFTVMLSKRKSFTQYLLEAIAQRELSEDESPM